MWSAGNFLVCFVSMYLTLRVFTKNYSNVLPNRLYLAWKYWIVTYALILLISPVALDYSVSDIIRRSVQLVFSTAGVVFGRRHYMSFLNGMRKTD